MLLTLLTLIVIFLIDRTLGKAFDSQRNNKDIFRKDLRGMQRAKEMLSSNQASITRILGNQKQTTVSLSSNYLSSQS
jgi:hypothetical protein